MFHQVFEWGPGCGGGGGGGGGYMVAKALSALMCWPLIYVLSTP